MPKNSFVTEDPASPQSTASRYFSRRRGWLVAVALCWLFGLVVITAPEGRAWGGAGANGILSAHASLLPKLPKPELTPPPQAVEAVPAITDSGETLTRVAWAATAPAGESEPSVYGFAVKSFREGRYAAAFGRFTQLADAGHKASAESALFMLRHGQELFGEAWSASEDEQLLWQDLVAQGDHALVDNPAGD